VTTSPASSSRSTLRQKLPEDFPKIFPMKNLLRIFPMKNLSRIFIETNVLKIFTTSQKWCRQMNTEPRGFKRWDNINIFCSVKSMNVIGLWMCYLVYVFKIQLEIEMFCKFVQSEKNLRFYFKSTFRCNFSSTVIFCMIWGLIINDWIIIFLTLI